MPSRGRNKYDEKKKPILEVTFETKKLLLLPTIKYGENRRVPNRHKMIPPPGIKTVKSSESPVNL